MKIKKLILSAITALSLFTLSTMNASAVTHNQVESQLQDNEATLFYMYSNKEGHFFLDPNATYENVIFVGVNDWKVDSNFKIDTKNLHHGQKFIGSFDEVYDWELTGIKKVETEYYNEGLSDNLEANQTTLFYMYNDSTGHYFIDPNAEYENVIYVSDKDLMFTADELHHGRKFIGTFTDETLWELTGLERVSYE